MTPTNPPGGNTTPLLPEVAAALAKAKAKKTAADDTIGTKIVAQKPIGGVSVVPAVANESSGVEVDPMGDARGLDASLRAWARSIATSMDRFKELISDAKAKQIHALLGFKSWTAYVADVIGKEMKALPVDDRRQIVALLAGEGMSQRAIADAVGVNHATVSRDQAAIEAQVLHDATPEPMTDGVIQEPLELDMVTGRDGKTYPAKPKPTPKLSNAFVNRFYRQLSTVQDQALKLQNLCNNKEFAAHLHEVCREHRDGVVWLQEVIGKVLDQLHTDQLDLLGGDT